MCAGSGCPAGAWVAGGTVVCGSACPASGGLAGASAWACGVLSPAPVGGASRPVRSEARGGSRREGAGGTPLARPAETAPACGRATFGLRTGPGAGALRSRSAFRGVSSRTAGASLLGGFRLPPTRARSPASSSAVGPPRRSTTGSGSRGAATGAGCAAHPATATAATASQTQRMATSRSPRTGTRSGPARGNRATFRTARRTGCPRPT